MDKPKTFWIVLDSHFEPLDENKYTRKEDALMSGANWATEERCIVHVYQCGPAVTYNPIMEEKSWD